MARGPSGEWQKLTWEDAIGRLQAKVKEARGQGIVFVTGLESGSFGELVDSWMKEIGGRPAPHQPVALQAPREGKPPAFRAPAGPPYDFSHARPILCLRPPLIE